MGANQSQGGFFFGFFLVPNSILISHSQVDRLDVEYKQLKDKKSARAQEIRNEILPLMTKASTEVKRIKAADVAHKRVQKSLESVLDFKILGGSRPIPGMTGMIPGMTGIGADPRH